MDIKSCRIDLRNLSLEERLRICKVLEQNGEIILHMSSIYNDPCFMDTFYYDGPDWCCTGETSANISYNDFIKTFSIRTLMNTIQNYSINVLNATLKERLKIKQLFDELSETIYYNTEAFSSKNYRFAYLYYDIIEKAWSGANNDQEQDVLSIDEAIKMFGRPKIKFII